MQHLLNLEVVENILRCSGIQQNQCITPDYVVDKLNTVHLLTYAKIKYRDIWDGSMVHIPLYDVHSYSRFRLLKLHNKP